MKKSDKEDQAVKQKSLWNVKVSTACALDGNDNNAINGGDVDNDPWYTRFYVLR